MKVVFALHNSGIQSLSFYPCLDTKFQYQLLYVFLWCDVSHFLLIQHCNHKQRTDTACFFHEHLKYVLSICLIEWNSLDTARMQMAFFHHEWRLCASLNDWVYQSIYHKSNTDVQNLLLHFHHLVNLNYLQLLQNCQYCQNSQYYHLVQVLQEIKWSFLFWQNIFLIWVSNFSNLSVPKIPTKHTMVKKK